MLIINYYLYSIRVQLHSALFDLLAQVAWTVTLTIIELVLPKFNNLYIIIFILIII